MATTIVTKKGSGAPAASDLVEGELAVDTTNGRLYTENSSAAVVELGSNPSGNITFGDNGKAIFGAGSDLQIYHSGSHSFISEAGTGDLYIGASNNIALMNAAFSENKLLATTDGALTLYHDGSAKLATTSTGIDITGTADAESGVTVTHSRSGVGYTLLLNNTNNGANKGSGIKWQGGGFDTAAIIGRSDATAASADAPGYLTFHTSADGSEDLNERMRIDSSGNVGIGTASPDTQLTLFKASTNADVNYAKMRMDSWGASQGKLKSLVWDDSGNPVAAIGAEYDGSKTNIHFHSQYNGAFKGTSDRTMSIMGNGDVGIGNSTVANTRFAVTGSVVGANIETTSSTAGHEALIVNRQNSDGTAIAINKAGTTVGSIGVESGDNFIIEATATDHAGLLLWGSGGSGRVTPRLNGSEADGTVDLGRSVARFKNLYLSGGVYANNASGAFLWNAENAHIAFGTNNTERMRIDASGNVGISVIPSANWSGNNVLQMDYGAFTSSSNFGAGVSTNLVATASGWSTKYLATGAASAYLQATSDGSHRFYTAPSGSAGATATLAERMRLDASGNLLVGTGSGAFHTIAKSSASNWALGVNNTSASSPYGMFVNFSGASPNNATSAFMSMSDSTAPRLVFNSNGGIKNYQANDVNLSDEREKNQFGLLDSTTDCVRSWDIVKYLYKDEDQSNPHKYGVIAQQVAEHCPEVISDWIKVPAADEVLWTDEDELPEGVSVGDVKTEAVEQVDRIGVKEQQMFWMLVKSHQEALDTIDALTARIAALES